MVYPNFLVSLMDGHLDKVLKVLIKTNGFDIKSGSTYLAIQTRVMYRYVNTLFLAVHHGSTSGNNMVVKHDINFQVIKIEQITCDQVRVPK